MYLKHWILGFIIILSSSSAVYFYDREGIEDEIGVKAQLHEYPIKDPPGNSDILLISDGSTHAVNTITVGTLPVPDSVDDALDLKQDLNEHLTDLSDGSLTGSKVGTGINATNLTSGEVDDARIPAGIARVSQLGGGFVEIISSELDDTSNPYVLISAEKQNVMLNNYRSSGGATTYVIGNAAQGYNFIIFIGDEYSVTIEAVPEEAMCLNGTQLSAGEDIVNTTGTLGQRLVVFTVRRNGVWTWECFSSDDGWVEETP